MTEILFNIIIFPIIQILEFSFTFSQKLFRETGFSVIFIGIVISVLCLPLYVVAEKWQQIERDTVKRLKPKTDKIKAVFKGDEQYMILSAYYKQNHYHPIYALRSSFGLLVQIPFFIAAYYYLSHLQLLKGLSFLFIKDLGAPDALYSIGSFSINILPIAMTLITCISSFIYTKGLLARDKIQLYGMAVLFLILLYNAPSALVLYWTMNILFSLLKNIYYKVQYKYKSYILIAFFSLILVIISVFSYIKFGYIYKTKILSPLLLFLAASPWILLILKKHISKITNKFLLEKSTLVFILSCFLIWALFGLLVPTQLIYASPQEFSFIDSYTSPLYFISITALQFFGLFIFFPVCLYFLFSENIKKYFSYIFLAISLYMLINVFLFAGNYGIISINFVYDGSMSHSYKESLINIIILIFLFIVSYIIFITKIRKFVPAILIILIMSLLGVSFFNIHIINSSFKQLKSFYVKEEKIYDKVSPIFSLSRNGKNVVVMMLDRAFSGFIPSILEESPELLNIYSGFIFYPNTVTFGQDTAVGSPSFFGGYEYTPQEIDKRDTIPLVEKHNQALLMLPRIFSENNFNVTATDPPFANYNIKYDLSIYNDYPEINALITDGKYTDIWLSENNIQLQSTSDVIKRNMFWYSFIKGMPLFLRYPLYMDGTWCSPVSGHRLRLTLNGYSVLDYLSQLTNITSDSDNNALIMTNNTTHEGSYLQAPDYIPAIPVTNFGNSPFPKDHGYHVTAAAIILISKWINFLKENNVYDNTRIIISSDHGPYNNLVTKIGLPFNVDRFNPMLFYKDFNSEGMLKTDTAFMSNADVPYLSLHNLIENPVNPFTGNEITIDRKKEPLYIAISLSNRVMGYSTQYGLNPDIDYYVHTNIFKHENWTRVKQ